MTANTANNREMYGIKTISIEEHGELVDSMRESSESAASCLVTISFIQVHLVIDNNTPFRKLRELSQYSIECNIPGCNIYRKTLKVITWYLGSCYLPDIFKGPESLSYQKEVRS